MLFKRKSKRENESPFEDLQRRGKRSKKKRKTRGHQHNVVWNEERVRPPVRWYSNYTAPPNDFERELASIDAQYLYEQAVADKKMEAEYVGCYLGSAMLTKGTTGLGVIQKPLRDTYFEYKKSPKNQPEIGIRINPRGIILLFPGSNHGELNDEFYDISSIHFIEAVQFVTTKHKDKKFYGAFLPIDDDPDANQEKLFVQLDKKNTKLTQISHPPMLACVMRRPTGVKAVDCHMFIIPHIQDALQMADMVHRFQERPGNPDYFYDRPPQDRREMHRPEPDVIPRHAGPMSDDPRYGPRGDSWDEPRGGPRGDPRDDPRGRDDNYEIYRGKGVELKQEHFIGGPSRPNDLRIEENSRSFEHDRSGPPNRSFEHDRGAPRGGFDRSPLDDSREFRRSHGPPRHGDRDFIPEDRRSREFAAPNGAYIERDSMGREYEFDNKIVHERQRSTGERSNERSFEMEQPGPGGPPIRNEYPKNRPAEYGARLNRSGDNFPGRPGGRSPEQPRAGPPPQWQGPRGMPPPPRGDIRDYDEPPYPRPYRTDGRRTPPLSGRGRSPPRPPSPPRGHSSPRARSPERDEIYSASNLESRIEEAHGKPVAKVPPNRHAGVRVLPSLPLPGAKNHLKPVSPRTNDPPTKIDTKPPTYNFDTKSDSEEESPYDNAPAKIGFRQSRAQSDRSPAVQRRENYERSENVRVKSEDYSYGSKDNYNQNNYGGDNFDRNNYSRDNVQPRNNGKQWSYEDEKEKFLKNRDNSGGGISAGYKSKSSHEISSQDRDFGQERGGNHMKDLEIADMFSNLRTGNANRGDVDFERSLGYLP